MKTKKVKVLRAFFYNRTTQKVGAVVDLPLLFANECIAANKAASVEEEPAGVPAEDPKGGKPKSGK